MRLDASGGRVRSRRAGKRAAVAFAYACLTLALVVVLLPFLWMVSTSLKSLQETFSTRLDFIPLVPRWENYGRVWSILPFARYFLNSLIVAGCTTVIQVALGSLAAYGFGRLEWPGRDKVFVVYLAAMMIPGQVIMIPNFLLMSALGGLDTYAGIILPQSFTVFGVFLLRQFFKTIPKSLEDAALMDGCGHGRIYARIILPLAKPGLAALGVFSFMFSWNNFLWPLVVSYRESIFTLPIGLLSFQGQFSTDYPLMMAAACQAMLPILILYAIAQRYFIEGVAMTGQANA
jgi:multiple sugar transport system permease protein